MSRAAFTGQHKLTKSVDFKRVFRKPFVSKDVYFKVLARSGDKGFSRLGMAVSRQVDKSAVGRNRIKRVIRESFRNHFSERKTPIDVIVLPHRETSERCNKTLFKSLEKHWCRLDSRFEG